MTTTLPGKKQGVYCIHIYILGFIPCIVLNPFDWKIWKSNLDCIEWSQDWSFLKIILQGIPGKQITWPTIKGKNMSTLPISCVKSLYKFVVSLIHTLCRYYAEFPCNFDLRLFPFDEQSCPMEFKMRNAIKAQVSCLHYDTNQGILERGLQTSCIRLFLSV